MFWFLKLHFQNTKQLVVWGAGKKGKNIARLLIQNEIHFTWICNNERKIDKKIFDVHMQSTHILFDLKSPQVIISVAAPEDQKEIREALHRKAFEPMKDYFMFC